MQRAVVAAVVGMVLTGRALAALAVATSDQPSSIVVFPLVIADGTRDTVIQLTNTSNVATEVHCFYINAAPLDPTQPASPTNPPLWQQRDFFIFLTAQQPTYWAASIGRSTDSAPGFFVGAVAPLGGFTGELLCMQTDLAGMPLPLNSLAGEASITDTSTGDTARYSALGLVGFDTNDANSVLCLGGGVSDLCPVGAEYAACSDSWHFDHLPEGAEDPLAGAGSSVHTRLTVVPCALNLEVGIPQTISLTFALTNEFEQTFSASTTVTGWADMALADIAPAFTLLSGAEYIQTRIQSASGNGFMAIALEFHGAGGAAGTAAVGMDSPTESSVGDFLILPPVAP